MAKKVLSIEIGQQVTKLVVTDYLKKNPHVYTAFSFSTPEDAMDDGYIRDKAALAKVINEQLKDNGIKERNVVFSIASSKIAAREITVPFVSENKLGELIDATAQDYFPVNIDEYTLAYTVIDTVKEKDKKSLKVSLLAAPDSLIQNYYSFADELGVDIEALDYYGNSSMQVLKKHISSGYCVCIQIGSLSTMVSVMKDGQQIMQRTIPYGTKAVVDTLKENVTVGCDTDTQAMEMLCRENVLYTTLDYDDESTQSMRLTDDQWKRSHQSEQARKSATDMVGNILLNIIRVIDYFHSKYPNSQLNSVYLTGMGVKIRGIDVLFSNELGTNVTKLDRLTNITFTRGFSSGVEDQTEYIAAIGATISPIGFKLKSIAERESKKESMHTAKMVLGLSIVTSAILVGSSWLGYNSEKRENKELLGQKESLVYINQVYDENSAAQTKYEEAQKIEGVTENYNNEFNGLIKELERKLPRTMTVKYLESNNRGVSMTIVTKDKISVAAMLMNLEKIDSLTNLSIPSVVSEDDSNKSFSFSVTADYVSADDVEEQVVDDVVTE